MDVGPLRQRHRWLVFDFSDNLLEYPYLLSDPWRRVDRSRWLLFDRERVRRFIEQFDAIIVGSRWLRERVQEAYAGPVYVIEDGQVPVFEPCPPKRFDAVWVGMNNNIEYVHEVLDGMAELRDFSVKIITASHKSRRYRGTRSNGTIAAELPFRTTFVRWGLDSHVREAAECRVGLAPLPVTDITLAKTENKLLLYSALGIPFLCSDIPAYREYVQRFGLGRICRTRGEWVRGLHEMVADRDFQAEVAQRGPEVVARHYGMDVMAQKYITLYEDLMGLRGSADRWKGDRREAIMP